VMTKVVEKIKLFGVVFHVSIFGLGRNELDVVESSVFISSEWSGRYMSLIWATKSGVYL
jgi:hypothetical protein